VYKLQFFFPFIIIKCFTGVTASVVTILPSAQLFAHSLWAKPLVIIVMLMLCVCVCVCVRVWCYLVSCRWLLRAGRNDSAVVCCVAAVQ